MPSEPGSDVLPIEQRSIREKLHLNYDDNYSNSSYNHSVCDNCYSVNIEDDCQPSDENCYQSDTAFETNSNNEYEFLNNNSISIPIDIDTDSDSLYASASEFGYEIISNDKFNESDYVEMKPYKILFKMQNNIRNGDDFDYDTYSDEWSEIDILEI